MSKFVFATYGYRSNINEIHIVESDNDEINVLYEHFKSYFDSRIHFNNCIEDFDDLVNYMKLYDVVLSNVVKIGKRQ